MPSTCSSLPTDGNLHLSETLFFAYLPAGSNCGALSFDNSSSIEALAQDGVIVLCTMLSLALHFPHPKAFRTSGAILRI